MNRELTILEIEASDNWGRMVMEEYERAAKKFPRFASAHEGFAILLEEVDELWEAVRKDDIVSAKDEAVQVGAMALRFLVDTCRGMNG